MIEITDAKTREDILDYLKVIRKLQKEKEQENTNKMIYSSIPLYYAAKHKLIITNLLVHPKIIKEKHFYESLIEIVDDQYIFNLLNLVLEYEFTVELEKTKLTKSEIDHIIKFRNKLEKKIQKKSEKKNIQDA